MPIVPWRQLELDLTAQLPSAMPERPLPCPTEPFGIKLSATAEREAHARRIAGHLSVRLPDPVDLVLTDNRSTMISYKRNGGRLRVRLHQMFQHADHRVLDALAVFVAGRARRTSHILDHFIARHKAEIDGTARRHPPRLATAGQHFDLLAVLDRVSCAYFGGPVEVAIGWGRATRSPKRRRRGVRSRALATYSFRDHTIRVSPVLDASFVPAYVMDWIVYHELLHHVLPVEGNSTRKIYHSERFRCLERAYPRYEEALAWEKANLEKLLS